MASMCGDLATPAQIENLPMPRFATWEKAVQGDVTPSLASTAEVLSPASTAASISDASSDDEPKHFKQEETPPNSHWLQGSFSVQHYVQPPLQQHVLGTRPQTNVEKTSSAAYCGLSPFELDLSARACTQLELEQMQAQLAALRAIQAEVPLPTQVFASQMGAQIPVPHRMDRSYTAPEVSRHMGFPSQRQPFLSTAAALPGAESRQLARGPPGLPPAPPGLAHPALPEESPTVTAQRSTKHASRKGFVQPEDFAVQKNINQELVRAGSSEDETSAFQVLSVASKYLDKMNGVNLSTAIHRIARACQRYRHVADQIKKHQDFLALVAAAERMVLLELDHREKRMPVKCCTIIAWSCASLRIFQNSLFKALAKLGSVKVEDCQSYEMTNILWAFGEFCKSRRQVGKEVKEEIEGLLDATARVFLARPFGAWKLQVLMSAMVSLTMLPWQGSSQQLFTHIAAEVAQRHSELANEKTKPLTMAFGELRSKLPEAFQLVAAVLNARSPEFVSRYALEANRSNLQKK